MPLVLGFFFPQAGLFLHFLIVAKVPSQHAKEKAQQLKERCCFPPKVGALGKNQTLLPAHRTLSQGRTSMSLTLRIFKIFSVLIVNTYVPLFIRTLSWYILCMVLLYKGNPISGTRAWLLSLPGISLVAGVSDLGTVLGIATPIALVMFLAHMSKLVDRYKSVMAMRLPFMVASLHWHLAEKKYLKEKMDDAIDGDWQPLTEKTVNKLLGRDRAPSRE